MGEAARIATNVLYCGDCLEFMGELPPQSIDLVIDSPPYEDARTYGIGYNLKGDDWVQWMADRTVAALRICRGLVATVVEGKTRQFRWSATPVLLMAELHRRGVHLRKPPAFHRVGIPGSGGPDWLRNDYEFIVCCTNGGKLPWSDNTAMGHPPKWAPGGEMSNRLSDGARVNDPWGKRGRGNNLGGRKRDGTKLIGTLAKRDSFSFTPHSGEPSETQRRNGAKRVKARATRAHANGDALTVSGGYDPPVKANPGNVIKCIVGGGVMGSNLAHENEAPFPEDLAEFFIRSFCPPGGIVLDRFCGSGTTMAVAERLGRRWIGMDCRESQVALSLRRIQEVRAETQEVQSA